MSEVKPVLLLVDDEPAVLSALKLLTQALGYETLPFNAPAAALAALGSGQITPNGILSDLRMPGMDGLALLSIVKKNYPDLPFVLMSGHASEREVAEAKLLGIDAFLGKPFGAHELRDVLQKAIGEPGQPWKMAQG